MDFTTLFAGVVTGTIGLAAWQYGRKTQQLRHMLIGMALMGYSWLFEDPLTVVAIGAVLVLFLFWPKG